MEYILLGKIINTHGIVGEVKVESYTDFFIERFKSGSTIYLGEEHLPLIVNKARNHKGFILVQFKDYEDINKVLKFKNEYLYKSSEDIKPLKNGEYYFKDLKDLDVYVKDICVGKVLKVEEGPKYNYLRIKVNDEEKLVPYLKEFVLNVDLDNLRIDIVDMEGLL